MRIKNPLVKHGLAEIVNAARKEAVEEKHRQLIIEIDKYKGANLTTKQVHAIIQKAFSN